MRVSISLLICYLVSSVVGSTEYSVQKNSIEETKRVVITDTTKNYFQQVTYLPETLPTFSESRDKIPEPVLEESPELIDLYWQTWQIAFKNFRQPQKGSNFVSNYFDEAFLPTIFQWDTIFMTIFGRYISHLFPTIESLDNFYVTQEPNGYICREIIEKSGKPFAYKGKDNSINPPIFAWAELEHYYHTADTSRLKIVLPILDKYAFWLENNRKKANTVHGLYWQTPLGSGMDNTPREGSGWIDMSSQMVLMYRSLAKIATITGAMEEETYYSDRALAISKLINKWMWSEEDGTYYDVNDLGEQVEWETIASFWPLIAEIASKKQAADLYTNLSDPKKFNRKIPFSSLSAHHDCYEGKGGYWRGGVWPPTNTMVMHGLKQYGYHDFASESSERFLAGMTEVAQKTKTIWEFYAPDVAQPGKLLHKRKWQKKKKMARENFVGWSGLGPVELLIADVIGISCNLPDQKISWRIRRTDQNGIKKLRFGDATVSLICEKRKNITAPAKVRITTDKSITLYFQCGEREKEVVVEKGSSVITI